MTTLAQILAIEEGARQRAKAVETAAYHLLQKADPLSGLSRTYQPVDEEGIVYPPELKRLQVTAAEEIDKVTRALTRAWDLAATKDVANTEASADVKIGETTLLASVPVTTLLWLEKALGDLRTLVSKLPVLDPAVEWTFDQSNGFYRSEPTRTVKSVKVPERFVKYDATPEHPAQVDIIHRDVPEGTWTTVRFSGALEPTTVARYLERVDALIGAVKTARAEANTHTVSDEHIGSALLGYVFR